MNKETNSAPPCSATLERHGAPHRCIKTSGHGGYHMCHSCGVLWMGTGASS